MSKHIAARLHTQDRYRILSLDGGGTRGIISIAFLEQIEALLQARLGRGDDFVLGDYFDLIGGTSVGGLVATQLALGARVSVIRDNFMAWMPEIFRKRRLGFKGVSDLYDARPLSGKIRSVVGMERMDSEKLKTGLAIVAKRADTGSVWIITNNPTCKYWNRADDRTPNAAYKLHDVLRATTAAPTFFRPSEIEIFEGLDGNSPFTKKGTFVDGAVSPHNNPSLQLFKLARLKGYALNWPAGEDKLLMISIGTGTHPTEVKKSALLANEASDALLGMIGDGQQLALAIMQWLSTPRDPWEIDREIGPQSDDLLTDRAMLSFQRYDMPLERRWLENKDEKLTGRRVGPHLAEA
ncbi:MAG: patatin-like phospholipase family protein, partial [Hyphomicrobium sp.]